MKNYPNMIILFVFFLSELIWIQACETENAPGGMSPNHMSTVRGCENKSSIFRHNLKRKYSEEKSNVDEKPNSLEEEDSILQEESNPVADALNTFWYMNSNTKSSETDSMSSENFQKEHEKSFATFNTMNEGLMLSSSQVNTMNAEEFDKLNDEEKIENQGFNGEPNVLDESTQFNEMDNDKLVEFSKTHQSNWSSTMEGHFQYPCKTNEYAKHETILEKEKENQTHKSFKFNCANSSNIYFDEEPSTSYHWYSPKDITNESNNKNHESNSLDSTINNPQSPIITKMQRTNSVTSNIPKLSQHIYPYVSEASYYYESLDHERSNNQMNDPNKCNFEWSIPMTRTLNTSPVEHCKDPLFEEGVRYSMMNAYSGVFSCVPSLEEKEIYNPRNMINQAEMNIEIESIYMLCEGCNYNKEYTNNICKIYKSLLYQSRNEMEVMHHNYTSDIKCPLKKLCYYLEQCKNTFFKTLDDSNNFTDFMESQELLIIYVSTFFLSTNSKFLHERRDSLKRLKRRYSMLAGYEEGNAFEKYASEDETQKVKLYFGNSKRFVRDRREILKYIFLLHKKEEDSSSSSYGDNLDNTEKVFNALLFEYTIMNETLNNIHQKKIKWIKESLDKHKKQGFIAYLNNLLLSTYKRKMSILNLLKKKYEDDKILINMIYHTIGDIYLKLFLIDSKDRKGTFVSFSYFRSFLKAAKRILKDSYADTSIDSIKIDHLFHKFDSDPDFTNVVMHYCFIQIIRSILLFANELIKGIEKTIDEYMKTSYIYMHTNKITFIMGCLKKIKELISAGFKLASYLRKEKKYLYAILKEQDFEIHMNEKIEKLERFARLYNLHDNNFNEYKENGTKLYEEIKQMFEDIIQFHENSN